MKKILSLVLCLFMLIGSMGTVAFADDAYEFNDARMMISSYLPGMSPAELIVPDTINGAPVLSIFENTFNQNEALEKVVLPEGMLAVYKKNFSSAPLLNSVTLPETLIAIGENVFNSCDSLTEITIPSRVSFIGYAAFGSNKALTSVRFTGLAPLFVDKGAFTKNSEDMVIYVPDDQIDAYTAVLPEGLNIQPSGQNAIVYDFTSPEADFTFDAATGTITGYTGKNPRVEIPATIGGVAVTAIGEAAFEKKVYPWCVILPEGVTTIGANAFYAVTDLQYVDLPDSVTMISDSAFASYRGKGFRFPNQLATMGDKAFMSAVIDTSIVLPESLTILPASAFESSRFTGITLPETLTTISDMALYKCKYYTELTIPASVTSIGSMAFAESDRLETVNVLCDASIIPADAFTSCKKLKTIVVPAGTDASVIDALAATGATVEVEGAAEVDSETNVSVVGEWNAVSADVEGMTMSQEELASFGLLIKLTLNEDGTGALEMEGEAGEITWTEADGIITISVEGDSTTLNVNSDGTLSGDFGGVIITFAMGNGAVTEAPVDVPAAELDITPFMGEWTNGFGQNLLFTDDKVCMVNGEIEWNWAVKDGEFVMTWGNYSGEKVTVDADGVMHMGDNVTYYRPDALASFGMPVSVEGTADDFVGVWNASVMEVEGMTMNIADLGMVMDLTINADGTVAMFDGESTDEGSWTLVNGMVDIMGEIQLILTEDGRLCMADDGAVIYFVRGEAAVAAPIDRSSPEAYVGEWINTPFEDHTLTINADGTMAYTYETGYVSEMTWDMSSGEFTVMSGVLAGDVAVIDEEGILIFADDSMKCYKRTSAPAAAPVDVPAEPAAAEVDTSALIGTWFDGDTTNFTINEDGTCVATDQYGDSMMEWEVVDGVPMITTGFWCDSPMILNEDGTLYVSDGWSVEKTFTFGAGEIRVGSTLAEPTGTVAASSAEEFYGEWIGETMVMESGTFALADMMMTMDLTISADGTVALYDGAMTDTATWTYADGYMTAADGMIELSLMENGQLCMAQEFNILYLTRVEGKEAPVDAPAAPEDSSEVPVDVTLHIGEWLKIDNGSKLTINADGTMVLTYTSGETQDMTWAVENGEVVITSGVYEAYVMTVNADDILEIGLFEYERVDESYVEPAEPADPEVPEANGDDPFVGTWKACYLATGVMNGDPRSMFGLNITLQLNADGTGSIDYPEATDGIWYPGEYGFTYFGQGGDNADMPMVLLDGGYLKYGTDLSGYIVFSQDEAAVWTPDMDTAAAAVAPVVPAATEEPAAAPAASAGSAEARLNKKFVAKTYTSFGQTMDASQLGAEYSVLFHEDGTCDFGLAGMVVPNLPWGLQKVATGLTEVDAFVINYYGTMFNVVLTADGFDMDYYGTMTLHFVPAE